MGSKKCGRCKVEQAITFFNRNKRSKDGLANTCKSCRQIYRQEHHKDKRIHTARLKRQEDPERHQNHCRKTIYAQRYGLTLEQFEILFKQQRGLCAICEKPEPPIRRLAVDHSHTTGVVRGLLCNKCNRGLGYFKDSCDLLSKAVIYLAKNSNKNNALNTRADERSLYVSL